MALRETLRFSSIAAQAMARSIFDSQSGKRFLVDALMSGGPGLAPKFAQFLAARLGVEQSDKEIPRPDPLPIEVIKSIICERNPRLAAQIESIDSVGYAASLGQVHRAILKDGREMAIKVQRPGAREAVDRELTFLLNAVAWSPAAKHAFAFDDWKNWLRERLNGELNYLEECRQQRQFHALLSKYEAIVIPKPDETLTTTDILVQNWESSEPITALKTMPRPCQREILDLLTTFVAESVLSLGRVQTDLQVANVGWRLSTKDHEPKPQLVLYDFGASMTIATAHQQAIANLIQDSLNGRDDRHDQHFCAMGFRQELLDPIQAKFSRLTAKILSRMLDPTGFSPADFQLARLVDDELGDDKWIFRTSGPPWFLYLMRTLFGLFHISAILGEKLLLRPALQERARTMQGSHATTSTPPRASGPGLANYLQVEIYDHGELSVSLQMPARAVEDLENLISDETHAKIAEQGLDIQTIKHRALQSQLAPQILFELCVGPKTYKVWLRK